MECGNNDDLRLAGSATEGASWEEKGGDGKTWNNSTVVIATLPARRS